jgi:hypothetical protein
VNLIKISSVCLFGRPNLSSPDFSLFSSLPPSFKYFGSAARADWPHGQKAEAKKAERKKERKKGSREGKISYE